MTTLHRMPTRPTVTEEDGTERAATDDELLDMDIKPVGTESGDEIVHAASRGPNHLPSDAEELLPAQLPEDRSGWDWPDVRSEVGSSVADAVLEAVHEADVTDGDGNVTTVRIRDKVGKGQPSNARFRERAGDPNPESGPPFDVGTKTEVESDLPLHEWMGAG